MLILDYVHSLESNPRNIISHNFTFRDAFVQSLLARDVKQKPFFGFKNNNWFYIFGKGFRIYLLCVAGQMCSSGDVSR